MSDLATGRMVQLWQRRESYEIVARKVPKTFSDLTRRIDELGEPLSCGKITPGTNVLYMCSKTLEEKRVRFNFGSVTFHLVLWDGKPVWVSSEDCVMKDVTDGDDGKPPTYLGYQR